MVEGEGREGMGEGWGGKGWGRERESTSIYIYTHRAFLGVQKEGYMVALSHGPGKASRASGAQEARKALRK